MKTPFFQITTTTVLMGMVYALSGCAGYQLGSTKPEIYSGVEKLHIPPFTNGTLEPRLSSLVTNAVLKKVQVDGTYRVSNRKNCDAVLVGRIKNVQKRQLRAVRFDTLRSQELSVTIFIEWHLEDPNTGQKLGVSVPEGNGDSKKIQRKANGEVIRGRHGVVSGTTIQFVDGNFQVSERNAISLAAIDAATKLVSQLADGW